MYYTTSHEWVREIQGLAVVGITLQAQRELGEIVYVECPIVGKTIQKGDMIAVLESTKAAIDVYSPVSGVIVEINALLQQQPGLINTAPESHGWIFRIQLTHPEELKELLSESHYLANMA